MLEKWYKKTTTMLKVDPYRKQSFDGYDGRLSCVNKFNNPRNEIINSNWYLQTGHLAEDEAVWSCGATGQL